MTDKFIELISDREKRFYFIQRRGLLDWINDKTYLKLLYKSCTGEKLDIENPVTLNEKLQYLKLYDRKKIYSRMVDKYEVKKYVSKVIDDSIVVPNYGVWTHFDEIDFENLPERFVLKTTHDSGSPFIILNKNRINKKDLKRKISSRLHKNYYYVAREWPYKNVKPRIIAEQFLDCGKMPFVDYKFYCYGGEPRYFMYSLGEADHNVRNHKFDMDGKSIDYLFKKEETVKKNEIILPENLNDMITMVKILCKNMQHVRIDLYNINGRIYFGEITFYSGGGFIHIDSKEYADYLASLIDLKDLS